MKYNDNGEWKDIIVKATDTLPIGTEVDYNGTDVPDGWEEVEDTVTRVLKVIYPVGAIYTSTNSTNPKDMFGFGTWEQIKDTFLLTAGDTYKAGNTGGAASHTHSIGHTHGVPGVAHTHSTGNHTLTVSEMPSHTHTEYIDVNGGKQPYTLANGGGSTTANGYYFGGTRPAYNGTQVVTGNTGGSGAHNHGNTGSTAPNATTTNSQSTSTSGSTSNLPPYLVVYAWKRTA